MDYLAGNVQLVIAIFVLKFSLKRLFMFTSVIFNE